VRFPAFFIEIIAFVYVRERQPFTLFGAAGPTHPRRSLFFLAVAIINKARIAALTRA
jgi:hypothetical protein